MSDINKINDTKTQKLIDEKSIKIAQDMTVKFFENLNAQRESLLSEYQDEKDTIGREIFGLAVVRAVNTIYINVIMSAPVSDSEERNILFDLYMKDLQENFRRACAAVLAQDAQKVIN